MYHLELLNLNSTSLTIRTLDWCMLIAALHITWPPGCWPIYYTMVWGGSITPFDMPCDNWLVFMTGKAHRGKIYSKSRVHPCQHGSGKLHNEQLQLMYIRTYHQINRIRPVRTSCHNCILQPIKPPFSHDVQWHNKLISRSFNKVSTTQSPRVAVCFMQVLGCIFKQCHTYAHLYTYV